MKQLNSLNNEKQTIIGCQNLCSYVHTVRLLYENLIFITVLLRKNKNQNVQIKCPALIKYKAL